MSAIRQVIAGLPGLTSESIRERDAAVFAAQCPERLWPLWPVAQSDGALWKRLLDDERIARFSVYGLFPSAYPLAYAADGDDTTTIRYDGRTRGRVAIIANESTAVVIKPCQSSREAEIAAIAGQLNVGPAQLPTIPGFISEEFVDGVFLTDVNVSRRRRM